MTMFRDCALKARKDHDSATDVGSTEGLTRTFRSNYPLTPQYSDAQRSSVSGVAHHAITEPT
jgi:hypothetical protein